MSKVQRSQYEVAYQAGLKYHDGKLTSGDIRRELAHTGLADSTAYILATNVSYLLRGECYKRALSDAVTEDYLMWIRRDRGEAGLAMALHALESHIAYRRALRKPAACLGLERILNRHRTLLTEAPSESVLRLRWASGPFSGYADELPLHWFAQEGRHLGERHRVTDRRGKVYHAFCDVEVDELVATLDYRPYPDENEEDGMLLGVTRLHFSDEDRTMLDKVAWKPADAAQFIEEECPGASVALAAEHPYQPPSRQAPKSLREVRDRPGQSAFRRKLKVAYAHRCCITGCPVPEALEGAHIDPYQDEGSDHIQNGLLLRRDMHTLFDRHLIAIDPETMEVHVSKRARGETGYAKWHGAFIRLPNEPTHRPDLGALRRNWHKRQA